MPLAPKNVDMMEALRLTRQGRLEEAMAVLRGAPHAASSSGAPPDHGQARHEAGSRKTSIIDMVPPSTDTGTTSWTAPPAGERSAAAQRSVRDHSLPTTPGGLLDRLRKLNPTGGLQGQAGRKTQPAPVIPPRGAAFLERVFTNEAGSLSYKLYVPSRHKGKSLPLVVMLHGCTQSPDDFAAGTRMNECAEEKMFFVAYPAQSQAANVSKCWNWFNENDQQRGRGEPSLIAGLTHQIIREFPVDVGRIYVAGLSAGGAAAAILGTAYPDLYAAIGVHSGLACGAARDLLSAFAAMRQGGTPPTSSALANGGVPTIVFHGDADATVNPLNGDQVIAQARTATTLKTTVVHGKVPGGVDFTRTTETDDTGQSMVEQWVLHGVGHAWSGGSPAGTFTEPSGPDATREMIRFFLQHRR